MAGKDIRSSEMDLAEIKELYTEELNLLKRISGYGEDFPKENQERVLKDTLLLLFRIYSNLFSALLLTSAAYKKGKGTFFQLPIGIVLRCTFTDCIFALYILSVDKERADEELDLRSIEYANSLLERREVYRDQVKSVGINYGDDFIDHMWELTLEDNFLHLLTLTFDENKVDLEVVKRSKDQLKDAGFSKLKSVGTKEQKDYLIGQNGMEKVVTRLYHYYKYFSQYEHFSEEGQGDVLVSSEEDGNDNIHLPSAIRALSDGVEEMVKLIKSSE